MLKTLTKNINSMEKFVYTYSAHIRKKAQPELTAKLEIDATDREALTKLFRDLFQQDKHGVLRDIIHHAMLTTVKHNQQN